ncbi:MAG: hypothetical protein V2L15_02365 [Desulfobacteraceae bacterium]|jgi:hypothetical protein|nr:hypothetical protein [Desulfobacteraceae bacterium]
MRENQNSDKIQTIATREPEGREKNWFWLALRAQKDCLREVLCVLGDLE